MSNPLRLIPTSLLQEELARRNLERPDNRCLHLYGQAAWHDTAFIVGTPQSLRDLANAIEQALNDGHGKLTSFTSDGEGYTVLVRCLRDSWVADSWNALPVPYHDREIGAAETDEGKWKALAELFKERP